MTGYGGGFPIWKTRELQCMYESPHAAARLRECADLAARGWRADTANRQAIVRYSPQEVLPHVDEAWADGGSIRRAYEINFNRYFYEYTPPRPLAEIDADLKRMEERSFGCCVR